MVTQVAVRESGLPRSGQAASVDRSLSCCAEVPSELLDEQGLLLDGLIGFAFDVLGAHLGDYKGQKLLVSVAKRPRVSALGTGAPSMCSCACGTSHITAKRQY